MSIVGLKMGGGVPLRRQRHLAFGAAAGMVHPATGYLISRMLSTAPKFADAIAIGLESGMSDPIRHLSLACPLAN